ncbi:DNA ligase [Paenibacillus sp. SC116]|uniref:ATP-dependent DNA ligase n=1 Tax=Paenibacillus sp. SC116 TaxID=2968986 RepID=UPI00215A1D80|nr:DNA ligase [Paenibacillus sp. SC116]MCR8844152.1 DNA ligase [Paenibacillus sp. SC116]
MTQPNLRGAHGDARARRMPRAPRSHAAAQQAKQAAAASPSAMQLSGIDPHSLVPMAPILSDAIPQGPLWLHQLKWDGIRLIADCSLATNERSVRLYTKRMFDRTSSFVMIEQALAQLPALQGRSVVLDGEAVVIDPRLHRPSFSLILQRQRSSAAKQSERAAHQRWPLSYVLFDLIALDGHDLRALPYEARHQQLLNLFAQQAQDRSLSNMVSIQVADVYEDGQALWSWVEENQWEGVVSKLKNAPYCSGKKHQASFKRKKELEIAALSYGLIMNEGRIASLVLFTQERSYLGRVSIGLHQQHRELLETWAKHQENAQEQAEKQVLCSSNSLPSDLRRLTIRWFHTPLPCLVSALEMNESGLLRHPKLLALPYLPE